MRNMEASSIGRPRQIPTKFGIFSRWIEKVRFLKTSIGFVITFLCISVYIVGASIAPFGFKQESGCGHFLGMFSKDFRDSRVETSSNKKDASKVRAFDGTGGWCSSKNDNHPSVMVDLTVPMKIQALVLGLDGIKQFCKETQFYVEYGIDSSNLVVYSEDGYQKIFNQSHDFNANSLQMVLFRNQIVARMIKIQFLNVTGTTACVNLELMCCPLSVLKGFNYTGIEMYARIGSNRLLKRNKRLVLTKLNHNGSNMLQRRNKRVLKGFNYTGFEMYTRIGPNRLLKRNKRLVLTRLNHNGSNMLQRRNKRELKREHEDVYDNKGTINSVGLFSKYHNGIRKTIKIHAGVQFVKLTILYVFLNGSKFYQDDTLLDLELGYNNTIRITRLNQHVYRHATFFSTSHDVTVTFESPLRSHCWLKVCMYQLQYESVDYPGCDVGRYFNVECSAQTAFITSRMYPSLFKEWFNDVVDVIEIKGKHGQYIKMHFIDIDLSVHDYVKVFDVDANTEKQTLLWSYKNTHPLQLVESNWHIMRIKSKTGGKLRSRGFLGRYEKIDVQWFQKDFSTNGCPSGQFKFKQSCYSVHRMEQGFISQLRSEIMCQHNGGHLVSIGSEQEMEFIFSLCTEQTPGGVYGHSVLIGLLKVDDNSCYQWTDGQPLVYTAWFPGSSMNLSQPDGGYEEKCTALVFTNGHHLHNWHDVPCTNHTGIFVCEMPSDSHDVPVTKWNLNKVSLIDGERYFRCDTNETIFKQAVCDSLPNCLDNSDEMHCDADTCSDLQFRCDDGNCIPWVYYCDHVQQCKDGSDEQACSWPKCLTSEWKCDNNQCIPIYQRCDFAKHCFDGSDENNCGYAFEEFCLKRQFIKEIKQVKQSCVDWWIFGARWNGTFFIDFSAVAIEVVCIFKISSSSVDIITSIDGSTASISNKLASIVKNQETLKNNCSKTVEITCYNKNIGGHEQNYDVIHSICKFGNCKCLNVNWEGLDVVVPFTDRITVYDPTIIQILETNLSTYNISNDENGFVYITLSPVLCKTVQELSSPVKRCIFDFERNTCEQRSHLQNCVKYVCPCGYFKCPQSYCLPWELVCDGTKQCPNGNDETFCEKQMCSGLFRCRESNICLTTEKLCDGIAHCPMVDDEVGCNIGCPEVCTCYGSVFVCEFTNILDESVALIANVRKLDISYSRFSENTFSVPYMPYVGELFCHDSNIVRLPSVSFKNLTNLLVLDLSYNRIKIVNNRTFYHLMKLRHLNLARNGLQILDEFLFVGLKSLQYLNVSSNQIHTLQNNAFDGLGSSILNNLLYLDLSYNRIKIVNNRTFFHLTKLRHLNLTGNVLKILEKFSFVGLKSLQYLDVSSNQILTIENGAFDGLGSLFRINLMHNLIHVFSGEIFSPLGNLTELLSDLFHFCCPGIKPTTVTRKNCCPQQDEFSSCEDLVRNDTLRTSIWIVGIMSFFGNLVVIVYRLKRQKREPFKAHGLYVLNLSISDMLMGIYLLLIAVADAYYKGDYVSSDISWRNSSYCKLAGVLSTMSSEASVTFILFLTVDYFLKVRYPFKIRYHLTIRKAIVSSVVSWIIVIVLAILPNLYKPYFADYFYSQTSVCLALPFSKKKTEGWEYSVALFVVYNSVAFLVLAFMQIGIYNAGKSSNRVMQTNSKQDFLLARRITLILVTDFFCWVPIGILGIISLQGHVFPPDVYAWVAVFVLPINSALNPLLYTFSDVLNQNLKKMKETIEGTVYKYSMKNRRRKSTYRVNDWTIPSSTQSLNDVLKSKALKPTEAYALILDVVKRVADLQQNGYTVVNTINPDTVMVNLDKKAVVKAEINSKIKELVYKSDSDTGIKDIGLLTKAILRNLNKSSRINSKPMVTNVEKVDHDDYGL